MTPEERARAIELTLSTARHRAGWWRAPCPFCEGRDPTFSYNPTTGYWHCFRCRERGTLGDVPEFLLGAGPTPAEQQREIEEARRPPEGYWPLAGDDSYTFAPAREYLRKRGVREDVWAEAQIGACADGKYRGRIVVPNLQPDGSWLGYTTRSYDKATPKKFAYRYPGGSWRGSVVWNVRALTEATDEPLYVVEGVLKGLPYWPHAVAHLGNSGPNAVTPQQFALLCTATRPLVVVLDGDAHEQGWALAMRLRLEGKVAGSVRLPPGTDPDEVDGAWLYEEARASLGAL